MTVGSEFTVGKTKGLGSSAERSVTGHLCLWTDQGRWFAGGEGRLASSSDSNWSSSWEGSTDTMMTLLKGGILREGILCAAALKTEPLRKKTKSEGISSSRVKSGTSSEESTLGAAHSSEESGEINSGEKSNDGDGSKSDRHSALTASAATARNGTNFIPARNPLKIKHKFEPKSWKIWNPRFSVDSFSLNESDWFRGVSQCFEW